MNNTVDAALVAMLAQTGASWFMTGVIWTMQVLNYPLLALVAPGDVPSYEQAHNRRFARVVGPGVVVTVVSGIVLLFMRPNGVSITVPIVSLALAALIVAATIRDGARAHARLAHHWDAEVHSRLVRTNWVRVTAWTAVGLLDLIALASALT
jgi:hypothetical protein